MAILAALLIVSAGVLLARNVTNADTLDYDANGNGRLEKDEVLAVVIDYFRDEVTKDDVLEVLVFYFLSDASPEPTPIPTSTPEPPVAEEDVTAPELVEVTLDRSEVDTTEGPATIAVTVRAIDDLSGISYVQLDFESPSGEQQTSMFTNRLTSGSFTDGIYVDTITLPRFSESGTWRLEHTYLTDNVGNYRSYRFAELSHLGLAASFEVAEGEKDITPPELVEVILDRFEVDTTEGPATIAVTVRAIDDLSGISHVQLDFESPSGDQETTMFTSRLTSGSFTDGTYVDTITLPRFSESGTWRLEHTYLTDNVGNYRSYRFAELSHLGNGCFF